MKAFETQMEAARCSRNSSGNGVWGAFARTALLAASLATSLATGPVQAAEPDAVCSTAKEKAAAALFSDQVTCHAKALKAGEAADPECLAKAQGKFTSAFQSAEAKGGCATTNDAATIAAFIADRTAALIAALPTSTPPSGCRLEPDCERCQDCAVGDFSTTSLPHPGSDAVCRDSYDTCNSDPECLAYRGCTQNCASQNFTESCLHLCESSHPAGAALLHAQFECIVATCDPLCNHCGNAVCDPGEDQINCAIDCGCPTQVCGDGVCNAFCEGQAGCPADCPDTWSCSPEYFGDGVCDCGCGIVDSDCADATVASCVWCTEPGSCGSPGGCPGNIDPNNNAQCIP